MSATMVGSAGALLQVAAATIAPQFGQPTTPGHHLVCKVIASGGGTNIGSIVCSDGTWTRIATVGLNGSARAAVFYKNSGADEAPPSFTCSSAVGMMAQLSEWAGVVTTSPVDQTSASSSGNGNSQGATASSVDAQVGGLVIAVACWAFDDSGQFSVTTEFSPNAAGVGAASAEGNSQLGGQFGDGIVTGSGHDSVNTSITGDGQVNDSCLLMVSFKSVTTDLPDGLPGFFPGQG